MPTMNRKRPPPSPRRKHFGFSAGRVLEPGMGTGLFFALMPEALRDSTRLTGVEYDPIGVGALKI
jgi:hypothetical protein